MTLRAKRTTTSLLVAAVLGGAGVALALTLSGDAVAVNDQTVFCSEFVPNAQAESNYAKWLAQNPGEKSRWEPFRDAICAGQNPVPPTMTTAKGRGLVAAGKMALPEEPPPTTTTTTSTTTTTTTTTTPPPTTTTTTTTPPPSNCTKVLMAGGDLSSFLATLASGDVGCLRAGEYTDGCAVSWTTDASSGARIVLQSYPGEQAILHTSLGLAGDYLTARKLRIADISLACGGDMSGFTVQGANDVIEFSSVFNVTRHGILTNTSSSNVIVHGNYIDSVGSECNLDHGVYFQTSGRITRNVFTNTRCGYGIHLYSGPSNVIVSENTSVGSKVRAGILINCSSNCTVVNNIFASNATAGITYRACASGCVVDNNITWNNAAGAVEDNLASQVTNNRNVNPQFSDGLFHVAAGSPAVNTARADFAYFPDRDGVPAVVGASPDLGAYER